MPKIINNLSSEMAISTPKRKTYRGFLLQLGKMLKKNDLNELKFVLKDDIPDGKLEEIDQPQDLFAALEERALLGPEKFGELRECLEAIDRPKMIEMIDEFEDADTKYPLKLRSHNRLKKDGYSISVQSGRHFETSQGEFVEIRSGSTYRLTLTNGNNHRCKVNVEIDGYEVFSEGILMAPRKTVTLERPSREAKKFKFFAIRDAPPESGINKWRKDKNGLIQIKFTPEKADMKITCVASGTETQTISCSKEILDVQFLKMVSEMFNDAVVTVMVSSWKPLAKRGIKLVDYGVCDGSRVNVNIGGTGGVNLQLCLGIKKSVKSKKNNEWRAGATTLEDESDQKFRDAPGFPIDPSLAVTLNLRLVAREIEIPLPSTGNPTPLTKATLIPPPVPN
jgi:hypothetical protein